MQFLNYFTSDYRFLPLVFIGPTVLNLWLTLRVGSARKTYGVDYPQLYAEESEIAKDKRKSIYNCIQRAHQNTLETLPLYFVNLALCALDWPKTATVLGLIWHVARVQYTLGYSSGKPSNREAGSIVSGLIVLGMGGLAAYSTVKKLL